jgi:hypothetical protein
VPACFLLSGVGCWRDPARPGRPLPSRCAGAGDDPAQRPWRPFRHGGGRWGTEGRGHARLWWYSILSTRYIGMWFYRPVTTIGRVIRPDFCVNANLQNFFRVNDNLQNFFMGDLCVNANQH